MQRSKLPFRSRSQLAVGAACLVILAACATAGDPDPLLVAAAASLKPPLEEIGTMFTEETGIAVTFVFSASGTLAEQIRNGAPFDVFASADSIRVDQLIREGYIAADSRTVIARGQLVLVSDPALDAKLASVEDLLSPQVRRVAIANPAHAPFGLAAIQALERSSMFASVSPRTVNGESVLQAGEFVLSGNAYAGLVSETVAISLGLPYERIPQPLYDPIVNTAGVIVNADSPMEAARFLEFLSSPRAQVAFEKSGLLPFVEGGAD